MAYPSDLTRTKDWGAEILYSADLEAQLDLIIAWAMAVMNKTSGHKHDATDNEGPKVLTANINDAAGSQGDAFFSSGSAISRLAAGTLGQCLTTGGAAANPSWEGMTTRGDIEYMGAANRARLAAAAAAGYILQSGGAGADPSWLQTLLVANGGTGLTNGDNLCKAWINLDGTGVIAADDSFNVSGVVDNGVGDYTITWDTNFADTNYCAVACASGTAAAASCVKIWAMAAGTLRIQCEQGGGTDVDMDPVCVAAFGDQ